MPWKTRGNGACQTGPSPRRTPSASEGVTPTPSLALGVGPESPPPPVERVVIPAEPIPLDPANGLLDLFREEVRSHLPAVLAGLDAPSDAAGEAVRQLRAACRLMKLSAAEGAVAAVADALAAGLPPPAADWSRYVAHTLGGVIATDPETYPAWADESAPTFA
ncbi:MAG: hypothetical protein K2X82_04930, partial [Gemmataceae bacterium]|nr:hypothetical protein [Gemmataceae bacterium]